MIFVLVALISFAGSIQPGPLNLAVIHTALGTNSGKAVLVAFGGVIPEIIYSAIALWFSVNFLSSEWIGNLLQGTSIAFFLIAGLYLFFKTQKINTSNVTTHRGNFFLFGLMSGLFNPLLFAFWLMVLTVFQSMNYWDMSELLNRIAFITGPAIGAFGFQYLMIRIIALKRTAIFKLIPLHPSRLTGIVFISLALWEAVKLVS